MIEKVGLIETVYLPKYLFGKTSCVKSIKQKKAEISPKYSLTPMFEPNSKMEELPCP